MNIDILALLLQMRPCVNHPNKLPHISRTWLVAEMMPTTMKTRLSIQDIERFLEHLAHRCSFGQ